MALWLWFLIGVVLGCNVVFVAAFAWGCWRRSKTRRRWLDDRARFQEWTCGEERVESMDWMWPR